MYNSSRVMQLPTITALFTLKFSLMIVGHPDQASSYTFCLNISHHFLTFLSFIITSLYKCLNWGQISAGFRFWEFKNQTIHLTSHLVGFSILQFILNNNNNNTMHNKNLPLFLLCNTETRYVAKPVNTE